MSRTLREISLRLQAIANRMQHKASFEASLHGIDLKIHSPEDVKPVQLDQEQAETMSQHRQAALERIRARYGNSQ